MTFCPRVGVIDLSITPPRSFALTPVQFTTISVSSDITSEI